MSKTEYKAKTVGEFIGHVKEIRDGLFGFPKDDPWGPWFRGHKVADWDLRPRLYRDYGDYRTVRRKKIEDEMREEFIVRAPILCENLPGGDLAQAEWEWYFMMQHFGTPTRLLDWTEGALLALYFAIKDNRALYDAAVWVLDPFALNNGVGGGTIGRDLVFAPTDPGVPYHIRKKLNLWLARRLTKMKGLPKEAIAVYPRHTERRISTQRSCFTIHGTDQRALDTLYGEGSDCLAKITIPTRSVLDVRRELDSAGIDEVTIFPDLTGLGRAITARWRPDGQDLPHQGVYTRLRPSKIHGVGVFAIVGIKKDTPLFEGENPEMPWFDEKSVPRSPKAIWALYDDFAVFKEGRYGCPQTFNRLTSSWYLNEPRAGDKPNVLCDPKTYEFRAARDIKAGEELTVNYKDYSEDPPGTVKKLPGPKTKGPGRPRPNRPRPG